MLRITKNISESYNFEYTLKANRRKFIKLTASFGLFLWADAWSITERQTARATECTPPVIDGPRNPQQIGLLPPQDIGDIWSIFNYIGQAWRNGEFCQIKTLQDFKPIIDLKTYRMPSYLTEYREAIRIFRQLKLQFGEQEALRKIFFEKQDPYLCEYVLSEFLQLQISQGGFLKFGYMNYLGYEGGPFDDPSHLPYRGVQYSC